MLLLMLNLNRKYLHWYGSLIFRELPRAFTLYYYASWKIAQPVTDILEIMLGLMQFFLIWKKM